VTDEETIIEVSTKHSPPGSATPRSPTRRTTSRGRSASTTTGFRQPRNISIHDIGRDQLLFTTTAGTPISRNTFRTRVWLPAVKASGIDFPARMHDVRHAHASWLLAEGSDLKSVMERMTHAQIQTTQKYLPALPDTDRKNLNASPAYDTGNRNCRNTPPEERRPRTEDAKNA
jgi:integrase